MPKTEPFEKLTDHYDAWFEEHSGVYAEELEAIRRIMPPFKKGVEIGVGTGRFAAPLGIGLGLEPSKKMAQKAKERGIGIVEGCAEAVPLPDGCCDLALFVTTICFVDDVEKALGEIYRILQPGGHIVVGFVDRETPLGRKYQEHKEQSRFYKAARFFSAAEVLELLKKSGFTECVAVQTLFGPDLEHMKGGIKEGFGEGAFVAMRCKKPDA
ncbi:class I SAM-dependent methyltransferase [Hydrogenimonas sp. SS33]|uniref:class I SAM-dependent methyltransferase n=1 Tax=Hydrogenimonas leucolamina TaxID=2954236 RepID=UPI00336C1F0C